MENFLEEFTQKICNYKSLKIIIFLLALPFAVFSQNGSTEKYLLVFTHKDIGQANMVLEINIKDSTFEAYTRQNADVDILGSFKAKIARKMTNFKEGSLLRIDKGIVKYKKDSLLLSGVFISSIGNYYFNGHIVNKILEAKLRVKNGSMAGSLSGSVLNKSLPLENYPEIVEKAINISNQKFYNKSITENSSWKSLEEGLREVSPKVQDDLEMIFAFYYFSDKLKTSHFALLKTVAEPNKIKTNQLILEEKSKETAYLKIKTFDGPKLEVDSVFKIILDKKYSNLIIDLSGNTGGTIEAGMALAKYLFDSTFYGGVFLTQKWFNKNLNPPKVADYNQFPFFSESNFDKIISGIHTSEGLCLKIIPNQTIFTGKIYVITDKKTASTCEPLVYALKQRKRATIYGQNTAGAMMNGEKFELEKGFSLYVPTADYYTSDGYRIDQKGIKPDLEIKPEEAINYILDKIKL